MNRASVPANDRLSERKAFWAAVLIAGVVVYLAIIACVRMAGCNVVRVEYVHAKQPEVAITQHFDGGLLRSSDPAQAQPFAATYGAVRVEGAAVPLPPVFRLGMIGVAVALAAVLVSRSLRLRRAAAELLQALRDLSVAEKVFFLLLGALFYFKQGIIDMHSFAYMLADLPKGINFYQVGLLQGRNGDLPTFPYSPISYFYFSMLSEAQLIVDRIGLGAHPYSLLQLSFLAAYCWLVRELVRIVAAADERLLQGKALYYFIFFNPFGLYYILCLGQIDIFAVALLVAGLRRLLTDDSKGLAFVLLLGALVSGKPQHMLALPVLFMLGVCMERGSAARRYYAFVVALTIAAVAVSVALRAVPGYYASLAVNPQAPRLLWSTWWTMLSDSIVINRPLGFMAIATTVLLYLMPLRVGSRSAIVAIGCLGVGALIAAFQASFAHTFGLAIFLFPGVMLLGLLSGSLIKATLLSAVSVGLLSAWGTGLVGDFTNTFGLHWLSSPHLAGLSIGGFTYPSLLNTVETSLYLLFAILFLIGIAKVRDAFATDALRANRSSAPAPR